MSAEPDPSPPAAEVPCRHCRLPMPAGASLCSKCNHYQDWRGMLSVSSTVLALLVALLSVATSAVPVLVKAVQPQRSEVSFGAPALDGTTLRLILSNTGQRPAAVNAVTLNSPIVDASIDLRWRNPEDAFIPAGGSKQIVLEVIPLLSEEQAYQRHIEAAARTGVREQAAALFVSVQGSDGRMFQQRFQIDPVYVAGMLRAHADKCSTVERGTFENGCLGLAEVGEAAERRLRPER